MSIKKKTKDIVSSGMLLGAGNVALSKMGAPAISGGASLGALTSATYGLESVSMLSKAGKKLTKKKK